MTVPGEFIFLDMGNYSWLLEDPVYYTLFTARILTLLHRGFHAKFIIHYASCNGYFTQLFHDCSSLIFNWNMEWLCYRYYDEQIRSYLDLNARLKKQIYDVEAAVPHEPFIYLFQMEKMVQRASTTEAGAEIYLWISAEPH